MGAVRPCVPLALAHRVRRRLRVGTDRASTGAARSIPWRRPAAVPSPACGRELRMRVAVLRGEAIQIRTLGLWRHVDAAFAMIRLIGKSVAMGECRLGSVMFGVGR